MPTINNPGQLTDEQIDDFIDSAIMFKLDELYPDRDNSFKTQLAGNIRQRHSKLRIPEDLTRARLVGMGIESTEEQDHVLTIGHDVIAAVIGMGIDILEKSAISNIKWSTY